MATRPSHILGMNARYRYTKMNPASAKQYGFSKLKTKELLTAHQIPTAQLYHVFESLADLEHISWDTIPTPFVIKPVSGSAGKGILIINKKKSKEQIWIDSSGNKHSIADLELHIANILDGEYSTWGSNHKAMIEEKIVPHAKMARLAYKGTPDIRIIIFNSVPVMAMARIPTMESAGRANLDKGAIGLGIDIGSGITTYGIKGKSGYISHFPHINKKVNGILIPDWQKVLEIAVRAARVAGFKFMGADIFVSEKNGPMIVELNGFPGLSIQICNKTGLKRRLERVEGLDVLDAEHGVKIARALFTESFIDQSKIDQGIQIISTHPKITVFDDYGRAHTVEAMVKTGRHRSAISSQLAEDLDLVDLEDLLWRQEEGIEGKVPVVEVPIKLKKNRFKTAMVVTKRLNRTKYKIELGRKDIQGYLIGEVD